MTVVLTTGGTIGMEGPLAGPTGTASFVERAAPERAPTVEAFCAKPSVHLVEEDLLGLARRIGELAAGGEAIVVTHGTDVLEEVAFLCDVLYAGMAPVVFTGAMRPADALSTDGPQNVQDALAAAGSREAEGQGVLVCFAGRLHLAREVRKTDSVSVDAFSSPHEGPVGAVVEGRATFARSAPRRRALRVPERLARVEIASVGAASGGEAIRALGALAEGLVVSVPGAGHVPPRVLEALREEAARRPVIACPRPERGHLLRGTYGFPGAERDLRASGAIATGSLNAAKARMLLSAAIGAGLTAAEIDAVARQYDR